jgi:hypothetical protein
MPRTLLSGATLWAGDGGISAERPVFTLRTDDGGIPAERPVFTLRVGDEGILTEDLVLGFFAIRRVHRVRREGVFIGVIRTFSG